MLGVYLYVSGSAMRLFGVRMTAISARDAVDLVMGNIADVAPYRRSKGDRNVIASLRLAAFVLKLSNVLDRFCLWGCDRTCVLLWCGWSSSPIMLDHDHDHDHDHGPDSY